MSTIPAPHPQAISRFMSTFSLPPSVFGIPYHKAANNDERSTFDLHRGVGAVLTGHQFQVAQPKIAKLRIP